MSPRPLRPALAVDAGPPCPAPAPSALLVQHRPDGAPSRGGQNDVARVPLPRAGPDELNGALEVLDRVAHPRGGPITSAAFMWSLEAGGRIPRVDTVEKLAKVLRISPCLLAYGRDAPCAAGDGSLSAGLPARLAQLRQERGLPPREIGQLAGLSHTFVRDTESRATVPTIANAEALAKALQVNLCWLASGVGERDLPPRQRPLLSLPTLLDSPAAGPPAPLAS